MRRRAYLLAPFFFSSFRGLLKKMLSVTRNRDNNNKKKEWVLVFSFAHTCTTRRTSATNEKQARAACSHEARKGVQKKAEAAREGAATAQFLCGEWVVFPLLL